ncbi:hypothetical protein KAS31_01015 [Candidatus Parcubacteria bacterium]|nr:hypothetical protein [Candidatus Parcubacteria bacterium]
MREEIKIKNKEIIKKGDLVIIKNTKNFIENKIYKVYETVRSSILIRNELGLQIHFRIDDSLVYKVQDGY